MHIYVKQLNLKILDIKACLIGAVFSLQFMMTNWSFAGENTLTISVPPFPPFDSFVENPDCVGVSVLALQEVTNGLKLKLELITYPYTRILLSLKTGELDLALIFKNSTIEHDVEYIGALSLSKVLVITKKSITIRRYQDLYKLKNIAVIRNAQFSDAFDQDKALNKVDVVSYEKAIRMLELKLVDGVIGSQVGIEYALSRHGLDINLMTNSFELGSKEIGLHLSKKSPYISLLPLLTAAVKANYQKDLIYALYQHQIKHCLPTK
tara:strand:+ start:1083 stop:1877 length:795 start_codon:yes stop_codon:yes gene_type:complete